MQRAKRDLEESRLFNAANPLASSSFRANDTSNGKKCETEMFNQGAQIAVWQVLKKSSQSRNLAPLLHPATSRFNSGLQHYQLIWANDNLHQKARLRAIIQA